MEFPVPIPFADWLGLRLVRWGDGEAEIQCDPSPQMLNSFQVVHGGVSMTLLDIAMAHAARSVRPGMGAVTIEMKTSFMVAAQGPLQATGRLLRDTATMAFVEAELRDAAGQLCAHATGTFRYVRRLPVGAASVHPLGGDGA